MSLILRLPTFLIPLLDNSCSTSCALIFLINSNSSSNLFFYLSFSSFIYYTANDFSLSYYCAVIMSYNVLVSSACVLAISSFIFSMSSFLLRTSPISYSIFSLTFRKILSRSFLPPSLLLASYTLMNASFKCCPNLTRLLCTSTS